MTTVSAYGFTTPNASGDFLKAARTNQGMSVGEIAELVGCSDSTIRRYEREGIAGSLSMGRLASICRAYGVSSDSLVLSALVFSHDAAGRSTPVAQA